MLRVKVGVVSMVKSLLCRERHLSGAYGSRLVARPHAPLYDVGFPVFPLVLTGHPKVSGLDTVAIASGAIRRSSLGSVECRLKTVDQTLVKTKKVVLIQITDGSGVQRTRLRGLVGIGRYKDDWYIQTKTMQLLLKLDTVHFWKLHVQYKASGFR